MRHPAVIAPLADPAVFQRIGEQLLEAMGLDITHESVQDTPRRWAHFWTEFLAYDDPSPPTTFTSQTLDQMVVVSGLRVWSLCEHHLLPFWVDLSIGYITHGRVLGLSKFGRIARQLGHSPQVQERLVTDIADAIGMATGSPDVAVCASGEHLCMTMRGIRAPHRMKSSITRGLFREDARTREEFFHLVNRP